MTSGGGNNAGVGSSLLERASAAYDARSWDEAAQLHGDSDASESLSAEDLERWGLAASMSGRDEESDTARERAHYAYAAAGKPKGGPGRAVGGRRRIDGLQVAVVNLDRRLTAAGG
ncbi:MAG TPA: hypothetical protein VG650_15890 [Mycobacteriales bacterium]|nr:hypothetical protein [Mycobacteriales bacterium]